MTIQVLIEQLGPVNTTGDTTATVSSLVLDSRKIMPGALFFALKGALTDGHTYIDTAIEKGAVAIVCSDLPSTLKEGVCYIQVKEVHEVVGVLASAFYGNPTAKMKVIGVTGTNGKTTVATVLFQLFESLGEPCGLISTVENRIGASVIPSTHTTPDAISLQQLFAQMLEAGCTYAFMEVSSHAVHQHRIGGVTFAGGIFTNITHDHLDYHKTFDEYIRVKKSFFDHLPKTAFALTNIDDKRGAVMLQNTKARKQSYALRAPSDFKGKVLENNLTGLLMQVNNQEVHFRMTGLFNAYNLLAAYGAAVLCGKDSLDILTGLSNIAGAPGRFETMQSPVKKILGIIDYAHTPDALQNVLSTIRQFGQQAGIITVVGCGGDRDRTKRPEMARVACDLSTTTILTSDNPRTENPETILDEMVAGLAPGHYRKMLRISDRKEAIKTACNLAQAHDVILVAGKGHETYQEINGVKHHFDDREVLMEMFNLLEK
ncbi:MAG: UDP-N-acetylmuramoyl-L-alanyl-D-glutamate--2,6-diaminopimelate ligase [Bacteroidetes bacterium 43-16]|nr:MAG: UDP-N-acetylmuramoyl-L-alanyl-D-glutamate--2,6-diaminopimelate ligase [Bacteroidetes bacterium 43-16]